jgi:hypothetical protein
MKSLRLCCLMAAVALIAHFGWRKFMGSFDAPRDFVSDLRFPGGSDGGTISLTESAPLELTESKGSIKRPADTNILLSSQSVLKDSSFNFATAGPLLPALTMAQALRISGNGAPQRIGIWFDPHPPGSLAYSVKWRIPAPDLKPNVAETGTAPGWPMMGDSYRGALSFQNGSAVAATSGFADESGGENRIRGAINATAYTRLDALNAEIANDQASPFAQRFSVQSVYFPELPLDRTR